MKTLALSFLLSAMCAVSCGPADHSTELSATPSTDGIGEAGASGDAPCVHLVWSYENGDLTGHYSAVCSTGR